MPDLFEMKRPLAVNFTSGQKTIAVAYYPHADGVVILEPFWEQKPPEKKAVVLTGEVRGDGPWRVGNAVLTLVGCQGTDPDLAQLLAQWEFHLQDAGSDYYQQEDIRALAREYGAQI